MKTNLADELKNNQTLKTIFERRAVRQYRGEMIEENVLNEILNAGRMAPSAMNRQPWKFYILTHQDTIDLFSKALIKVMPKELFKEVFRHPASTLKTLVQQLPHVFDSRPKDPVFHGAPVVVFISSAADNEWAGLDTGMCAQNMMLAAKSLGVESCPVGFGRFISQTPVFSRLELPAGEVIQLAVVFGYGAENPKAHPRKGHDVIFIDRMECC